MPNANILQHKHDLEGFTVDTKTATFALNGTQSNAIDLEGYQLGALIMPAAWTASSGITFLASDTIDGTYGPVYDDTGTEVKVTAATGGAAGTRIPIVQNALALASLRFIKLRSGIAGTEVAQTAARTITLSLKR